MFLKFIREKAFNKAIKDYKSVLLKIDDILFCVAI